MKKSMLSVLALSSVVLLAGCNNAPAEEEVVLDETTGEEVEYVIDEQPEVEIVPAEEEVIVEEVLPEEEAAVEADAVEADAVVEEEPAQEVIAE
ncbi:hypothetical protein IKO18_04525 [bacterium]|jgi:hypothetical protein|nr:hypothetical protein [bacterium]